MSQIRPFRALRPEPSLASKIAAVPYDVVNTEEARALAAGNALSFLHVSRAEIDLPADTNPYADIVYRTAAERFAAIRADMVEESEPALYFYKLRMGTHEQTGLAACYSVDEYDAGLVKKHEKTRRDKEDDRTRHITELRAQTGPVFLTYQASAAVDAVAAKVAKTAAALRLCRARRRRAHDLEGDGRRPDGRRRRVRRAAGALHRRRAPSRGERGASAQVAGARSGQGRRRRGGLVPGGGVPGQPDAGAAVQPDREGPGGPARPTRSWTR